MGMIQFVNLVAVLMLKCCLYGLGIVLCGFLFLVDLPKIIILIISLIGVIFAFVIKLTSNLSRLSRNLEVSCEQEIYSLVFCVGWGQF